MESNKKKRVTIYVKDDTHQEIVDIADKHDWSYTKTAEKLIEVGIDEEKKKEKEKKK